MKWTIIIALIMGFNTHKIFAQKEYYFDGYTFGSKRSIIENSYLSRGSEKKSTLYKFGSQYYTFYEYLGEFGGFWPKPKFVKHYYDIEDCLIQGEFIWSQSDVWSEEDRLIFMGRLENVLTLKYGQAHIYTATQLNERTKGWYCEWDLPEVWILLHVNESRNIILEYYHRTLYDKHLSKYKELVQNDF